MTQFTRGPWRAGGFSSIVGVPVMTQPDATKNSFNVCGVAAPVSREENIANARLIAAAPARKSTSPHRRQPMSRKREISFDCTSGERIAAQKIATRVRKLTWRLGGEPRSRQEIAMDLIATHANGCPMDFHKLYNADDFNLAHDVFGIEKHLDRETGKLGNFFRPRCAAKQTEDA